MYHPGLGTDRQLAQISYAEVLAEAAQARADRQAQAGGTQAATRPLALALAAAVPLAAWLVWVLIAG